MSDSDVSNPGPEAATPPTPAAAATADAAPTATVAAADAAGATAATADAASTATAAATAAPVTATATETPPPPAAKPEDATKGTASAAAGRFAFLRTPKARYGVAAGAIVSVGLVLGAVAFPREKDAEANAEIEPAPRRYEPASRRTSVHGDLLAGPVDEEALPSFLRAAESRAGEESEAAASRPADARVAAEAPASREVAGKPTTALAQGLLEVAEGGAESRAAASDPTEFAAAEAAYQKGDWRGARDAALRFLLRPGPLGDRQDELIGRAHVRLALSLARIRREEVGAADESLPEPVFEFPERRP